MRSSFIVLFLLGSILFFSACDKKRVFDDYRSVRGWKKDSVITFDLGTLDTSRVYNLFINLRNTNEYRYSNIFLITNMQFPNGKVISDTLEYEMAKPSGEWLGTGFGDVKENKLWYKKNVKFDEVGSYQVSIRQAMRKNDSVDGIKLLKGITDVGFRIEKTDN